MTPQQLQEFEADLDAAQNLDPREKVALKQEFFQKHIASDPEWGGLPAPIRMQFAKKFGIAPGFAQLREGEFASGGMLDRWPATYDQYEASGSDQLRSMPKASETLPGQVEEPSMFLDPVNAMTGMGASLLAKAPFIGATLAARNPLLREAGQRGILKSGLDWQAMGLNRLPGFLGRQAGNIMERFRPQAPPTAPFGGQGPGKFSGEMIPEPRPTQPTSIPQPQQMPQTGQVMGFASPTNTPGRPRISYGPRGIEYK